MEQKTPADALRAAIATCGGLTPAAISWGVKGGRYQTVQQWLRARVPAEYCPVIERETAIKGARVSCEALRPDVQWGVIRGSDKKTA